MNRLVATIPLYISESVSLIISDTLCRLGNIRSKNDLLILKSHHKDDEIMSLVNFDGSHSTSMSSQNDVLVDTDFIAKPKKEIGNYEKLQMIESELDFLVESLKALQVEIETNGQFTKFNQIINIEQSHNERFSKKRSVKKQLSDQHEISLGHQQESERVGQLEVEELRGVLSNLETYKQELIQKNEMERKFMQKKINQNILTRKDISTHELKAILSEKVKIQQLISVEMIGTRSMQQEMCHIYRSIFLTREDAINRYNQQKEMILNSINKYEKSIKSVVNQLSSLSVKYVKYKEVVDEDQIIKEELQIEAKKLEYMNDQVKIIQNWWRWYIVKNDLMPKPKVVAKKPKK